MTSESLSIQLTLRQLRHPGDLFIFLCRMNNELVQALTSTFEAHAQQTDGGVECCLARDLQHLLGYHEWRNFTAVISKAKTACEVSRQRVADHFVEVNKMVELGSGGQREIEDLMLRIPVLSTLRAFASPREIIRPSSSGAFSSVPSYPPW